jgi:putative transposase
MTRGKKIKGRKRHIIVDTLGLLLIVVVHSAKIQDRTGARQVFRRLYMKCIDLKRVWADGGYTGTLIGWVQDLCSTVVEIVKRTEQHKFVILPRRWVVERTFAWLNRSRRLSKDYERLTSTSEAMVYMAMTGIMVRRLAKNYAYVSGG